MSDYIKTYQKAKPTEVIEIGDVIMLDTATGLVTRAYFETPEDYLVNSKLVIGVCVKSDNTTVNTIIIDGGTARIEGTTILNGGNSDNTAIEIIDGGDSSINKQEIIDITHLGQCIVNITSGDLKIGDKLCISREPGKARSREYLDRKYYALRSIGKVIKILNDKQVLALLDIE